MIIAGTLHNLNIYRELLQYSVEDLCLKPPITSMYYLQDRRLLQLDNYLGNHKGTLYTKIQNI
jgi:hypothetical protein